MRMPLHNLAFSLQGGVIECVRQLAQAAAGRWNQAPLPQHPAGDKAAPPARASDLLPEAENCSRRNDDPVQSGGCAPQILHLAQLIGPLLRPLVRPQGSKGFPDGAREPMIIRFGQELRAGLQIAKTAPELMKRPLGPEHGTAPAGGHAPFRWFEQRRAGQVMWRARHEGSHLGNDWEPIIRWPGWRMRESGVRRRLSSPAAAIRYRSVLSPIQAGRPCALRDCSGRRGPVCCDAAAIIGEQGLNEKERRARCTKSSFPATTISI